MRVLPYSNMLLGALVIAALLCFFFALYYYGTAPGYLDHVEPGLTLLSWGLHFSCQISVRFWNFSRTLGDFFEGDKQSIHSPDGLN